MKKLLATAIAFGLALVSMLPGIARAGENLNHNQTLLRASKLIAAIVAVGLALTAFLPGIAAAGYSLNHNQTTLRG